ncbi:MAG: hypothetical protein IJ137_01955 [Eubacterium sp.]|nr:hypothetical protein [Eubacterium sp.]
MSIISSIKDAIGKGRPTREEKILQTGVQLDQLKEKYNKILVIQRRNLRNNLTPHEREVAESKIRSCICAYTIVSQASRDLDEISTETELNKTLKDLNASLKALNSLGTGRSYFTRSSLNHQVSKMALRENKVRPEDLFTDQTQGIVDHWLGSQWSEVAQRYIEGADLEDCIRESQMILEKEPMPNMDLFREAFAEEEGGEGSFLKDLVNMDI